MLRIGDFSKLSQTTVKTLRYYDEIGLLRPSYVDEFTGYRYYSVNQLPRLNRILALKDLGFTLDQVVCLLDEELSPAEIRGMLRMRQMEIQQHIAEDQAKLERVKVRLRQIEQEDKMSDYDVVLKQVASLKVASVRSVVPTYSDVGRLFGEISGYLGQYQATPAGPALAIYHDAEYRERDVDVEVAVPLTKPIPSTERVKFYDLPGSQMACVVHQGGYDSIGSAYNALMYWIEANNYRISGPSREIYLQGPQSDVDPSSYVTEVQFPVEKA